MFLRSVGGVRSVVHVQFSATRTACFTQLSVDATAAQGGEILQHDATPREMGLHDGCCVHVQVVFPLPDSNVRARGSNASMSALEAHAGTPMPETSGPRASAFRWNNTRAVTPVGPHLARGPMPTVCSVAPSLLSRPKNTERDGWRFAFVSLIQVVLLLSRHTCMNSLVAL